MKTDKGQKVAEFVRNKCVKAARQGFEDAQMRGLCADGAKEAAVSAIQMLDLEAVLQELESAEKGD